MRLMRQEIFRRRSDLSRRSREESVFPLFCKQMLRFAQHDISFGCGLAVLCYKMINRGFDETLRPE